MSSAEPLAKHHQPLRSIAPSAKEMAQFRAKRLDLGGFVNIRVLRDHTKRKVFEKFEPERYEPALLASLISLKIRLFASCALRRCWVNGRAFRQALRYLVRNTALPTSVRGAAQLQLTRMPTYTRPTQIKNRCIMAGTARGVLRAFRLGRVSIAHSIWDRLVCPERTVDHNSLWNFLASLSLFYNS